MAICTMGSAGDKTRWLESSAENLDCLSTDWIRLLSAVPSSEKENCSTEGMRKDSELFEWLIFLQRWLSHPASAW